MVKIPQQSGTASDIIDAIAAAALDDENSAWSDGDSDIVNTGQSSNYWHNARVLHHSPTGLYLLLMLEGGWYITEVRNDRLAGVTCFVSEDWETDTEIWADENSAPAAPAGRSTIPRSYGSSDLRDNIELTGSYRHESFQVYNDDDNRQGPCGFWVRESSGVDRDYPVRFVGSVTDDIIAFGAWGRDSSGIASVNVFEHVTDKFFNDGISPSAVMYCNQSHTGGLRDGWTYPSSFYGWNEHYYMPRDNHYPMEVGQIGTIEGPVGMGQWGGVHPHPESDEFLYRRAPLYQSGDQEVPVAVLKGSLPSQSGIGLGHGHTVDVDGTDYRYFEQTGEDGDVPVKQAILYE